MNIASTAVIHPHVELGKNVIIEDFCIIGVPLAKDPHRKTIIGDGAVIRSHTVIYAGNKIGNYFATGNKANIREYNIIGDHVSVGTLSVIEHQCFIDNHVRLHTQTFVPEFSILKKGCWLGPNVVLTNAKYPKSKHVKEKLIGPVIGENAIIGANVTILPGITIEENCLIAAGSLVTSNTVRNGLYLGNPAKLVKFINEIKEYEDYPTL